MNSRVLALVKAPFAFAFSFFSFSISLTVNLALLPIYVPEIAHKATNPRLISTRHIPFISFPPRGR